MSFKLILTDSFNFFRFNFKQIAALCIPFLLASSILNHTLVGGDDGTVTSGADFLLSFAINMAFYPIYTGALILLMARQAEGQRPGNSELISAGLGFYLPLLLLNVITKTLMLFGFLAFIVPGFWLAVRFSFAEFFLVLQKVDPREAIVRSVKATRNHFMVIFSAYVLLALPIFLLILAAGNLLFSLKAGLPAMVAVDTLITFFSLFVDIVLFRIYMQAAAGGPVQDGL